MAKKVLTQNSRLLILFSVFIASYFIPFSKTAVQSGISKRSLFHASGICQRACSFVSCTGFFHCGGNNGFFKPAGRYKIPRPEANKFTAYSVASVSGAILAVCSCTVLPLFKKIYKKGAGIGPAINILAIILTGKVLGWQIGLAGAIGAVSFAFLIGFLMHVFLRKDDEKRLTDDRMFHQTVSDDSGRTLEMNILYLFSMVGILIFLNWAPSGGTLPLWDFIYKNKYFITGIFFIALNIMLARWFSKDEIKEWIVSTRDFSIQIIPLLFSGVLVAGFLLGRPGHQAFIPTEWVAGLVGGNSIISNLTASISGAFMYFAPLTEVPIMQGLIGAGMGKGPALAPLLSEPYLSLPSMLVIHSELD